MLLTGKDLEMFCIIVREYWVNNKSIRQINEKYNIDTLYWMVNYDIPRRKYGFSRRKHDWSDLTNRRKHYRMRKIIPKPNLCPICDKKSILNLTNLNHEYNENIKEWSWKCSSCHTRYDHEKKIRYEYKIRKKENNHFKTHNK